MLDATPRTPSDPWLAAWVGTISRLIAEIAKLTREVRLPQAQVHRARREIKRLRALLRLAPHDLAALGHDMRDATGEVRQRLGQSRDAAVMLDTLGTLAMRMDEAAARIRKVLIGHKRAFEAAGGGGITPQDRLRLARLSTEWHQAEQDGSRTALRKGAVRTYRKARKRAEALGDGDAVAVHELRKAAVDHQYHLTFFAQKKGELQARHKQVKRLRDRLGSCHDLDHLRDFVRSRADVSASDLIALEKAMQGRRRRLFKETLKLAAKLFEDNPRQFGGWLKHEIGAAPSRPS